MPDYKEMYFKLYGAISDAMEILDNIQKEMEELYVRDDNKLNLINIDSKKRGIKILQFRFFPLRVTDCNASSF